MTSPAQISRNVQESLLHGRQQNRYRSIEICADIETGEDLSLKVLQTNIVESVAPPRLYTAQRPRHSLPDTRRGRADMFRLRNAR